MIESVFAPGSRTERYSKCIEMSKRVRWDIEADVIRGRQLDFGRKFMPDALARMECFDFATASEKVLVSQIQGRSYANMFALVERFIGAKMLEVGRGYALCDQLATESMVRLIDEELKHQALFRRFEVMTAPGMPAGYRFAPSPNEAAGAILAYGNWAVLALTCHMEMASIEHYRHGMEEDDQTSELWKDMFRYHMREEQQHAMLDELEWQREDEGLAPAAREMEVTDFIALLAFIDGLLRQQAQCDADYFLRVNCRRLLASETEQARQGFVTAYRWQYILSGMRNERFAHLLASLCTPGQLRRVEAALASLLAD